jgi:tellurium resistance protein TerD
VSCAQRVQSTPPPYYTPPQAGYPQAGYPQQVQQGYPQQGYPPPHDDHQQQGGRRFGTGALIGAGAAGLVGGALLNEALSDDEPDITINNYDFEE